MASTKIQNLPIKDPLDAMKIPTGGFGDYAVTIESISNHLKNNKDFATKTELKSHAENKDNPHNVTKQQIGLSNVDDTSDADKPVSIQTQLALNNKANVNEVYKKSETYTKTEIDGKVSSVAGGYFRAFETKADLNNATGMTVGQVAKVMNDLNPNNNGDYYFNGTTWVKGYDSLTASKLYTDSEINFLGFKSNINIFDKNKVEYGKYINYTTGRKENASSDFVAAGLYPIESNTEYQVPQAYVQQFAFYDSNKVYISGQINAGSTKKFTTPVNAKFIGLTVDVSLLNTFMLCKSSEYPTVYVPHTVTKPDLIVETSQVKNLLDYVEEGLGFETINIVDPSKFLSGYYVNWQNGQVGAVAGYTVAGEYKIKPNTTYKISSEYFQQFAFYDSNKVYISGQENHVNHEFTTPANAYYVKFTVPNSVLATFMVTEKSIFPPNYVPYSFVIKDLYLTEDQIQDIIPSVEEGLGFEVINIIDKNNVINDKYIDYTTGNLANNTDFIATYYIPVKENVEYQTSSFYSQQFAFYNSSLNYISGLPYPANNKFIPPANSAYIRMSIQKSQLSTIVVAETSRFPSEYLSHDYKIATKLVITGNDKRTTEIWVSADLNDTDAKVKFKGKNAIQNALDSITDASANNRYIIRVKRGLYKITQATEFLGYRGYPAMILTKDHVDIIGQGEDNTIVWAELPYNDADIGASVDGNVYPRNQYQTVYDYSNDSILKDITFVAKNLRYTIHIDNPNGANKTRGFDNVGFLFKGDKGSLTAMGCGTSTGEKTYITGGRSLSDNNFPFASHNNIQFDTPSFWSFKGHNFTALNNNTFAFMQSDGSLLQDQLELIGCSFGGMAYKLGYVQVWLTGNTSLNRDSFNHAEWYVTGYGNEPFLFDNQILGQSLLFKTSTTGVNNNIRFDINSSAYPIIIKNNQMNTDTSLYHDNRSFIDGYIVQDGSINLPAYAWGCKDLSEMVYLYDNGINYTSLSKRLGNRTSNTLTLGVIVNGTTQTITFNKDYTSMTNAQILADMQAQLTGVTIEFVSYGREYYPTITDVSENVYNNTSTYIPKGSLVSKVNGYVRLANGNDKVYGVALDNIPVSSVDSEGVRKGQGRVLKRGYISSKPSDAFFVLADNQNPAIGTRFKVVNGQLVTDVNGSISVNIDSGVISINC